MTQFSNRIDNFCAGPCTLPLPVLQQAQAELLNFQNSGMSLMEISHRSKLFEPLHYQTLELAQTLINAPDSFTPLLLTGGASQQFAMSALNLLPPDSNQVGALINSGVWANKALEEGQRIAPIVEIWNGQSTHHTTLPNSSDLLYPDNTRYLHLTSNETIDGIQYHHYPDTPHPLVIDASSDYYARPIPWEKCDLVYGGVQKNLAPAGLTLIFIRKTLLQERPDLPKYFNYKTHADHDSLYNTPPTWQIYLLNLSLKWMQQQGGIAHFQQLAQQRAQLLYSAIDQSDFYTNPIAPQYRSHMNVIFRTPSETLDTQFWQTAEIQGLSGLKGHRIVGGIRASLYNALSLDSVHRLIEFMHHFAKQHG